MVNFKLGEYTREMLVIQASNTGRSEEKNYYHIRCSVAK